MSNSVWVLPYYFKNKVFNDGQKKTINMASIFQQSNYSILFEFMKDFNTKLDWKLVMPNSCKMSSNLLAYISAAQLGGKNLTLYGTKDCMIAST